MRRLSPAEIYSDIDAAFYVMWFAVIFVGIFNK